jgi:GNAT superfamily N-acetyltransferase
MTHYTIQLVGSPEAPMDLDLRQRVAALDRACLGQHDADPEQGWWWIASHRGEIVAYASVHPFEPSLPFFSGVGVRADHRGNGLQRLLMRRIASYMHRTHPESTLVSYTHAANIYSANNFIRCGWLLWNPPKRFAEPHWIYWRMDRKPKGT